MKTCFVLEGGALRGLYTAGVLDYLMDKKVNIDCIIGVSAGALFGVNYFSNQRGRGLRYNLKYCNDKRYMSVRSLLLTGNIVNKKFAYYKVSNTLDPFDDEAFKKSKKEFYSVATNLETGLAEYMKITSPLEQMEELRATSAMPMLSRIIKINNNKYLDGAVADSIPVLKALEMGYDKVVVVLTQPEDFRKPELTNKNMKRIMNKYKNYPKFVRTMLNRPIVYNQTLDIIKEKEKKKEIFVIRPSKNIDIDPIKKTKEDLQDVYDTGFNDMKKCYKDLNKYLA